MLFDLPPQIFSKY